MKNGTAQTRYGARGFSLAETLFALALLALLGSIIAGGLPVIIKSYQDVMSKEHADVLCSTVTNRVVAELRGATEYDATTKSFVSHSGTRLDGQRISITTDVEGCEGYATITFYGIGSSQGSSKIAPLTADDGFEPTYLLPTSTYTNGLVAEVKYENATATSVDLTVSIKGSLEESAKTYATSTVTVAFGQES